MLSKFRSSSMRIGVRHVLAQIAAALIALAITSGIALAQEWSLGPQRFSTNARAAAGPLQFTSSGIASLRAFTFVTAVGGVSFEAVAQPDATLTGKSIVLSYDPSQPDGSRLVVNAGGTILHGTIPDWQLRPITVYADSQYNAVVSLFGNGPDQKKYYYIQYHDAMKDTLFGMRMLQADILFMNLSDHWRIPAYDGRTLLGQGENAPSEKQSMVAAIALDNALKGQKWQSWILSDSGTQPTFGASNGKIVIKASPYYYFWRLDEKEAAALDETRKSLIGQYKSLSDSYQANIDKYNSMVETFNSSTDRGIRRSLQSQLDALHSQIDSQEAQLKTLQNQVKGLKEPTVIGVSTLTNTIQSMDNVLSNYNPPVHNAYLRMAQYSALFRYVKSTNPANWKAFTDSVAKISIRPTVITPTTWERPN
jgi:hypothetical protein